jgi:hypothetical protein
VASILYAFPTTLAGSASTSNLYAATLQVTNNGAGIAKAIHTGCFATVGSTGPCFGPNSQISPAIGTSWAPGFASYLTTTGINNPNTSGLDIESVPAATYPTDQIAYGIIGGGIAPLPVMYAFIHWTVGSGSASNARFLQLFNPSAAEIAYWDDAGNILAPTVTAGVAGNGLELTQSTLVRTPVNGSFSLLTGTGQNNTINLSTGNNAGGNVVRLVIADTNVNVVPNTSATAYNAAALTVVGGLGVGGGIIAGNSGLGASAVLSLQNGTTTATLTPSGSGGVTFSGPLTAPGLTVTGNVIGHASLDLALAGGALSGATSIPSGDFEILGSSTGYTALLSANAGATNYTMTLQAANDTLVGRATTDTLTNKSIAASEITSGALASTVTINNANWSGTALANANLANPSVTLGSTTMTLGATYTTIAGLASVTSTAFIGALTGHASLDLPAASPTFTGTMTGPDASTWTSGGLTLATALALQNGSAAAPSLNGQVTTGLYWDATPALYVTVGGVKLVEFESGLALVSGGVQGIATGLFYLRNIAAAAATPNILPNSGDTKAGIGGASGAVALIADNAGTSVASLTAAGAYLTVGAGVALVLSSTTIALLPTSCTAGSTMYVTNGVASPTYGATPSTTGAVADKVFCTGGAWVYGLLEAPANDDDAGIALAA